MRWNLMAGSVFFGLSALARADVTYSYVGAPFAYGEGAYTTADRVTGTFTLAAPLLPGVAEEMVDPVAFSFTDGVQTLTNQSALYSYFDVGTYPTAHSKDADLDLLNIGLVAGQFYDPDNVGEPWYTGIDVYFNYVNGIPPYGYDDASSVVDQSVYTNGPGVLSLAGTGATMTPEPASLALVGTGLLGVVGVIRRRLRR